MNDSTATAAGQHTGGAPDGPPVDPRPLFGRCLDQTGRLIGGLRPEQLALPTPCAEFAVRDLLGHIVQGVHRIGVAGAGGDTAAVAAPQGVPDDGWVELFAAQRAGQQRAWADDAVLERAVTMPFGAFPGRITLLALVLESTVHGWDLARALDRTGELDDELATSALAAAMRFVPAQPRGGPVPFAPVVEVPADAAPYDRLAGWLGRDPGLAA
jgi:uncharacterized protein (TIGR03086 family)